MLKDPKVKFEAVEVLDSGIRDKQACNFIKKENLAQVFPSKFCKASKNTFSFITPPGDCFEHLSNIYDDPVKYL